MSCCQPPASLAYLRALLSKRHDIAVHPAGALDRDTPPDDFYFYRPTEVLVPIAQIPLFASAAKRLGIRVWPLGETSPRVGSRLEEDRLDGLARFTIGANADLDTVLDRLVRAAAAPLRITPNHVVLTCPKWKLSPDGDPRVAAGLPLPRDDGQGRDGQGRDGQGRDGQGRDGQGRDGQGWDVTVAVIDGGLPEGFDANPLLDGIVVEAGDEELWPYSGTVPVLTFPQGHGSFVAGVVRQGAPPAQVRSYLAADQDGVTDEWDLGRQVDLALDDRPSVINLSLGATSRHDEALLGLDRLAAAASSPGGPIVVAAAGNIDTDRRFWPAAAPWAIGVAAVEMTADGFPVKASFSDYGHWVDACALGVDVISAFEARPYRPMSEPGTLLAFQGAAIWSGTSFAAPRVAAAVAALLAADPARSRHDVLAELRAAPGAMELPDIGVWVP